MIGLLLVVVLSVGDARDAYDQNRLNFSNAQFRCEWKESVPENFRKSIEFEIAFVKEILKKPEVRASFQSNYDLYGGLEKGETIEAAVARKLRLEVEGGIILGKYVFKSGEFLQVEHFDPLNPARSFAEQRKIKPFTPDGCQIIQKLENGKWQCLEPYPSPTNTIPIAWTKSVISVRSILPPVWGDSTVRSAHSHGADIFFKEADSNFSEFRLESGRVVFARPVGTTNCFFYLTSASSNFSLPDLILVTKTTDLRLMNKSTVEALINKVSTLRSIPARFSGDCEPSAVVYFDGIHKVMSGFCPSSMHFCALSPIRTSDNPKIPAKDRSVGVSRLSELIINEIRQTNDFNVIELPQNASVLDLDSGLSTVGGRTLEQSIDGLIGSSRSNRFKYLGVIAGGCSLLIAIRLILKRRAAR